MLLDDYRFFVEAMGNDRSVVTERVRPGAFTKALIFSALLERRAKEFLYRALGKKLGLITPQLDKIRATELTRLARKAARPKVVMCEIGCWLGTSSVLLGRIAKESGGMLISIDHWQGSQFEHKLKWRAQLFDLFGMWKENIKENGLQETVFPFVASSDIAIPRLADGQFDLIFIDGDHQELQVERDIRNSIPKLKDGGILCGDDYSPSTHPGVVRAVNKALPGLFTERDGVWSWLR